MTLRSGSSFLAFSAFALAAVPPLVGCSAAEPSDTQGLRASRASHGSDEDVARSSAADTAVWTAAYVGDAHAGNVRRQSNIQAKAALVMANDGASLSLALYFCGKGPTLEADTHWLVGRTPLPASGNLADLGGVTLTTADGWKAYVNMSGPGTVTRPDGVTFEWVASYVGDGKTNGLYRYVYTDGTDTDGAPLAGSVAGFIQWSNGSQGALQRAGGEVVYQVTPISPKAEAELLGTFPTAQAPFLLQPVDPIALTAPVQ
jgi:hypothetical protein